MSESEEEAFDPENEGGAPNQGKKGKRNRKKNKKTKNGKPGDWDCPSCGASCFASKTECFKCNAPKPEGGEEMIDKGADKGRPGDWECPGCGANCFASKTECFKCRMPKPEGGEEKNDKGSSKVRPGDWECPGCGANCFARTTECFKCRMPKPEGGEENNDKGGGKGKPGDWECPGCGVNVLASKAACFKCGATKPGGGERSHDRGGGKALEHPPRPGDWGCPRCSANNFASKTECFKCGIPKPDGDRGARLYRPDAQSQFQHSAPHAPRGRPQHLGHASSSHAGSFHRFASATRLPTDALSEWEHDLRQQLLDILGYLPGPLPLLEWINHRIGGEVETFQDDMGAVMIRLRSGNVHAFAPAAGGPPPRGDRGPPPRDFPENAAPKVEKRSMTFFEKLPSDSFNASEVKLRNAILEFLASWTSSDKATLPDLANDEVVDKVKQQFVPKVVPLEEWIEKRMGEEVLFRTDRQGKEFVDLTPIGIEAVQEKIDEQQAASKRKSENDIHPTGGKRQRV